MVAVNSERMARTNLIFLFTILIASLICSCASDPFSPPLEVEDGMDYLPLSIGRSWTYQVDSVIYDPLGSSQTLDTVSAYIREVIADSFSTSAGLTYVLFRYSRREITDNWTFEKTIGVSTEPQRLLWQEEGRTLVKLVFPVYNGMSWDGTALFDPYVQIPIYGENMQPFKNWSFALLGKQEHHQVGPFDWHKVMRIQQADDENLIERRFSEEWYEQGVGMVFRRMMILDTQCGGNPGNCAGIPWEEKAEKGYILNQVLVAYSE